MELSGASEPEELLRFHHIVLWCFMSIYDFHPQRYVITGHAAISKGTSCFPSIHAAGFLTSLSSLRQSAKVWADYLHVPTTKFHWINIKQPSIIHWSMAKSTSLIRLFPSTDASASTVMCTLMRTATWPSMTEERSRMLQWSTKSVPRSKKPRESGGTSAVAGIHPEAADKHETFLPHAANSAANENWFPPAQPIAF